MKRLILSLIVLILSLPVALWAMQETPAPRAEITGVNSSNLPEVIITANVFDPVNQPILGLTEADFELVGELAGVARIVSVQNISDDELPFSAVLVIDTSSSMLGLPIERAREAAQLFVDSIGPNDSVAVYTFSNEFTLVQPYTTDKAALRAAIEAIEVGGPTGLYQAAYNSIGLAAAAPSTRRTVILLSDGAEYGGVSTVGRGAALAEAQLSGVPVYTIGLGYGIDRTYLRELADGTNTRFYESPDPEQLAQIYADLATLLTSQYIITLDVDVPADGTIYDLALDVTTPFGVTGDSASVRAPIPVPIVTAPVFDAPLVEPVEITPDVAADDPLASAAYSIDGGEATTLVDAPYSFTIDPETLSPGMHELLLSVTDVQGDTGEVTASFEVGALPPRVNIISNLDRTVENVQTVQVDIGGQTPGVRATFRVDDGRLMTDAEAPFAFDIDPLVLPPGAHILTVEATNEGGQTTTVEVPFTVANLAPYVVIVGVEEGDVVDEVITVEVDIIVTQTPVVDVEILVNGQPLDNREIPPDSGIILSTASLDPMAFAPGPATLTVRATNSSGGVSENQVQFTIAALPPIVVFENLADGDVLDADQDAVITFISQTPVSSVAYTLDGEALPDQTSAPWDIPLDVLALGPGGHTLTVTATTSNGETTTASVNFIVSDAPAQTATAQAEQQASATAQSVAATTTVEARITESAMSTIAASTRIARDATATERAVAATGTAEANVTGTAVAAAAEIAAQSTADSATQSAIQATRTQVAVVTSEARAAAAAATSTAETGARATQTATEATATTEARQTATAEAEQQASATSAAQSLASTATQVAGVVATQTATEATATTAARQTATAEAQQQASATAQSAATSAAIDQASTATATEATATTAARQTATAQAEQQATSTAQSAATSAALDQASTATATEATATTAARQTATAQAEQRASATADAEARASATANVILQATQTQAAAEQATATREALVVALAATSTSESRATATQDARLQQTQTAEAEAAQATATQAAADRVLTQTAVAEQATATTEAEQAQETRAAARAETATQDAAERADALTATASSRETATAQALSLTATEAAQVTATAQTALNVQATADAGATESADATQVASTQNAAATSAAAEAATENARATADAQATATASVTEEPTEIPPTEEPTLPATPTPRGTLVPVEAESQTADVNQLVPILVVIVAALIVLIVIYLILRGGRGRR